MGDNNYIGGIVKILETPKKKILKKNISVTEFRVQLPQVKSTRVINLVFWGNLACDVANYYKVNDYILIEGYLALSKKQVLKKVEVTVRNVYPFFLSHDRFTT